MVTPHRWRDIESGKNSKIFCGTFSEAEKVQHQIKILKN